MNEQVLLALAVKGGGGGGSTGNYHSLTGKPKINNTVVDGDMNGHDLGLVNADDELTTAQMNTLLSLL